MSSERASISLRKIPKWVTDPDTRASALAGFLDIPVEFDRRTTCEATPRVITLPQAAAEGVL